LRTGRNAVHETLTIIGMLVVTVTVVIVGVVVAVIGIVVAA
jgi:hypothetical protein